MCTIPCSLHIYTFLNCWHRLFSHPCRTWTVTRTVALFPRLRTMPHVNRPLKKVIDMTPKTQKSFQHLSFVYIICLFLELFAPVSRPVPVGAVGPRCAHNVHSTNRVTLSGPFSHRNGPEGYVMHSRYFFFQNSVMPGHGGETSWAIRKSGPVPRDTQVELSCAPPR